MATLHVTGFPDELYDELKQRATRDRRSLAQEVIYLLERGVSDPQSLSIMDLGGLGKEIWQGIDAAEYIEQERRSWD